MAVSEIIIMMLVYGGLFLYTARLSSSNNKIIFYGHYIFLIVLYCLISIAIWFIYKGNEVHINYHSGYEPISLTNKAIFTIVCFSIYNLILILVSKRLKRKSLVLKKVAALERKLEENK
ncbi:peptide ABC transporter permease [Solibacillus sp. FSL W7-1472]|uniref:peptide ABC transporter permease n=1 Tax=unclassified Solibacillus TaxID=2637870 RepID=UPI0007FB2C00|nr:peptide ABC transporter permease [Solibacillus silvestris]OBW60201.1 peptide ABC transporter permease [Solibacillus silvestris]